MVDELERAIREHGVESIAKVDLAVLEVDGNISILSKNYSHKTVKPRKKLQLSHNP
ncbi:MAG: YetF domain-containing protein [Ferruginibacter sp.]